MPPAPHILHIDMDAFFAAVEQLDHPHMRGKPVLVGGDPAGRGVVSTASYEARPFGCHSAMPMAQALRLCPHAIVVRPRMERYAEISSQVFGILERFTPLIEPLSIDEAFMDVGGSERLFGDGPTIAAEVKRRVREQTGLTASLGVAATKFVAKLASDLRKPDGLVVVPFEQTQAFLDPLPISRLWGVGKATLPKFEHAGVATFSDARRMSLERLVELFGGDTGEHFFNLVRGIDDRAVVPDREAKSMSHEVTFATDVRDEEQLRSVLLDQIDQVAARLRRHGLLARVAVLKVRTPDFTTATRRQTLGQPTCATAVLWAAIRALFETWWRQHAGPVRLIGAGAAELSPPAPEQLALFEQESAARQKRLDRTIDEIRERYGDDAIARGRGPRLT